jgi:hypothetical protein
MTTTFEFLRDLADEREEEAIETTLLFARGGVREYSGPCPLRLDTLRAPSRDERAGEALELAPLFSRAGLSEFEKTPTTKKRSLTVECQFWSSPSGKLGAGELSDPFVEIGIVIWDGRASRLLWPPKGTMTSTYKTSSSANGLIVPPKLRGIESDEITIMAVARFGGSSGQLHNIAGVFPVPNSDRFRLIVYVEYKTTTLVVSARNMDAAPAKSPS